MIKNVHIQRIGGGKSQQMNYKNLPILLKAFPNWVCWGKKNTTGRAYKIPYNPVTGRGAKANDPSTWVDFETAVQAVERGEYAGIGIEFHPDNGIMGIDFDRGEGKSRVAAVCKMLLGDSCFMGKLHTIEERFGAANLETYLAFIDDDITDAAFKSTDMLKQVITAATAIPIEKKGQQTYQGIVFSRILCCGNNFATALFDRSDGFFRRQLLLKTRKGAKVENPDRALDEKFKAELPGILNWTLEGLDRLISQGWEFTESERAKQTLDEVKRDACNVIDFMESDFVVWGNELCVFCKDITPAYGKWCYENAETPVARRTLIRFIRDHYANRAKYTENIREKPTGMRRRGFVDFACPPVKYAPAYTEFHNS